ncbi:uncharacterized protein LOC114741155 [Neltuma alba]|uniref:uncharacterized protein LOC114741155 n=1 Tax=Neltuma alba TaxID=207710 RepID=UPI0010A3F106|nr:uncharacterized protein LOC114741155 [Prosopis alba]
MDKLKIRKQFEEWKRFQEEQKKLESFPPRTLIIREPAPDATLEEKVETSTISSKDEVQKLDSQIDEYLGESTDYGLEQTLVQQTLNTLNLEDVKVNHEQRPGKEHVKPEAGQPSVARPNPPDDSSVDEEIETELPDWQKPAQDAWRYPLEPRYTTYGYEPVDNPLEPIKPSGVILNLDCEVKPGEKISQWIKESSAVIYKENMTVDQAYNFLTMATTGSVSYFFDNIFRESKRDILSSHDVPTLIEKLENFVWWEFVGTNLRQTEQEYRDQMREETKRKLSSLQLCNPCYLKEYLCQFQNIFHKGFFGTALENEYQIYSDMIFRKIQEPWGSVVLNDYYAKFPNENIINHTIGKKASYIREWFEYL